MSADRKSGPLGRASRAPATQAPNEAAARRRPSREEIAAACRSNRLVHASITFVGSSRLRAASISSKYAAPIASGLARRKVTMSSRATSALRSSCVFRFDDLGSGPSRIR